MLADPLSLTFASVTFSLARVSSDEDGSSYRGVDPADPSHSLELNVSHAYGVGAGKTRNRRILRLTRSWLATDPRVAGQKEPLSMTVSATIDQPDLALPTDGYYLVLGLVSLLTAGSYAVLNKVLGGET